MAMNPQTVFQDSFKAFGKLETTNKLVILGVLVAVLAGFSYLIFFADMIDYDYLYTNIEQEDAGTIIQELKSKGISFKVENRAILVPRQAVHELRMELASLGLPGSKGVGFEIFDNQKLGTSNFVQQMNYKRALEGELSRTISKIDQLDTARVHLVLPKKSLFQENEIEPTGSVVVRIKSGAELANSEVKSIMHLVSSSVPGLSPKNITIIDSKGNLLSRAEGAEEKIFGSSPVEYRAKMEQDLASRVEDIVARVVGVGKVVAKVTVDLDFKRETETKEIFDPDAVVVRSENRIKENRANQEGDTAGGGGVPGAQSNSKQGAVKGADNAQQSNSARERDLINYEINKVIRQTVRAVGDIKKISVAVLVDGTYVIEEEDGEDVKKYQPRTPEEINKIRELTKQVVGFSDVRGDGIEVSNVPFETSVLEGQDIELSFLERFDFIPQLLRFGIIIGLAFLMIFFLFKPLVEWVIRFNEDERLREIEREQEDVVKSMEEQLVDVRRTIESSTVEYKKRLSEVCAQSPDTVLAVLRSWIGTTPE